MLLHKFVIALLVMALSGCSSFVYKRADGPDVATVRLTNASGGLIRAMESQRGDCTDYWHFDDNIKSMLPNDTRTTPVASGSFFVLQVAQVGGGNGGPGFSFSICSFNVGFVTEAKAQYEIEYRSDDPRESCVLRARWKRGDEWKPLVLTKMKLKNLIGPASCVKLED